VLGVRKPFAGPGTAGPSAAPFAVWEAGQDEVLVQHTQMRKGIAAQMTRAAQIPVAHSTFEADMTAVVKLRSELADAYKAREGVGLSFLPFVVKAVVEALHGHPTSTPTTSRKGCCASGGSTSGSPSPSTTV